MPRKPRTGDSHVFLELERREVRLAFLDAMFLHAQDPCLTALEQCTSSAEVAAWAQRYCVAVDWLIRVATKSLQVLPPVGGLSLADQRVFRRESMKDVLKDLGLAVLSSTPDAKEFDELLVAEVFTTAAEDHSRGNFAVENPDLLRENLRRFRARVLGIADEEWKRAKRNVWRSDPVTARRELQQHCAWTVRYYMNNELPNAIAPTREKSVEQAVGKMRALLPLPAGPRGPGRPRSNRKS